MTRALKVAARFRGVHMVAWLSERREVTCWDPEVAIVAARNGHLSTLIRLCSLFKTPPSVRMLLEAIERNHFHVAEWIWFSLMETNRILVGTAISAAPLRLAKWMIGHATNTIVISIDQAATRGDYEFVMWASSQYNTATTRAMDGAATNGHLDIVYYLHNYRHEGCTTSAIDGAAKNGYYEVVDYLLKNRSERFTAFGILSAATRGDLRMLKLLVKFGRGVCPVSIFDHSAAHGQLDVLKWLKDQEIN